MAIKKDAPRNRVDMAAEAYYGQADADKKKTKRDRSFEDRKREEGAQISLRMDPATVTRFKQLAEEEGVLQGPLADKLLNYAMDAIQSGELVLVKRNAPTTRKTVV